MVLIKETEIPVSTDTNIFIQKAGTFTGSFEPFAKLLLTSLGYPLTERAVTTETIKFKKNPVDILIYAKEGSKVTGIIVLSPLEKYVETRTHLPADRLVKMDRYTKFPWIVSLNFIGVDPSVQHTGLARKLFSETITRFHPKILMALTENPALVHVQNRVLEEFGYVTFFDGVNVSSERAKPPHKNMTETIGILASILRAPSAQLTGHLKEIRADLLQPTVPDVHLYPIKIQHAFERLIAQQKAPGNKKAVIGSLISVRM